MAIKKSLSNDNITRIEYLFGTRIEKITLDNLSTLKQQARKRWHPDRPNNSKDEKSQALSHRNFTQIEGMIKLLSGHLENNKKLKRKPDNKIEIKCPACFSTNKIPQSKRNDSNIICGKCKINFNDFYNKKVKKEKASSKKKTDSDELIELIKQKKAQLNKQSQSSKKKVPKKIASTKKTNLLIYAFIISVLFLYYFFFFQQNKDVDLKSDHTEENLPSHKKESINTFLRWVKENNIQELAQIIQYPLKRSYPIPAVHNKQDFIARFNNIFDEKLIDLITYSNINDWILIGSQELVFNQDILWLNNKGKLVQLNYESAAETLIKENLIKREKSQLFLSLRDFDSPVLKWKNNTYKIRIDKLMNGNFRYSTWYSHQKQSTKPNIVLNNGTYSADGNGGNHFYTFNNGEIKYIIYINILNNPPTGKLTIYNQQQLIGSEQFQ